MTQFFRVPQKLCELLKKRWQFELVAQDAVTPRGRQASFSMTSLLRNKQGDVVKQTFQPILFTDASTVALREMM
jgi:hypothetical protein